MSAEKTTASGFLGAAGGQRLEVFGILATAGAILLALALGSYDARAGHDLIGPVGAWTASVLVTAFGYAAWVLPAELAFAALRLFRHRRAVLGFATAVSTVVLVFISCALLHLALPSGAAFGRHMPGGEIGEVIGAVLSSTLGLTGAYIVTVTLLLVTLVLRTPWSVVATAQGTAGALNRGASGAKTGLYAVWSAWRQARELERAERARERRATEPKIVLEEAGARRRSSARGGAAAGEPEDAFAPASG
ncbi:MAG: DNA translocase FtsK 4TM domain-containing protein, partial [Myxococcales bacterium]|nr:DNA translocase FtsK 4TM domain-containing protein [Myxococcales bacterium]